MITMAKPIDTMTEAEALEVWTTAKDLIREADGIRREAWARVAEIRQAKSTDEERRLRRVSRLRAKVKQLQREAEDPREALRAIRGLTLAKLESTLVELSIEEGENNDRAKLT